jgi:hypothetical protein
MLATSILGILVATAALGCALWWSASSMRRLQTEPRYRRRFLFWAASLYGAFILFTLLEVTLRHEPIQSLAGLPIGLVILWLLLRSAVRTKVPPV